MSFPKWRALVVEDEEDVRQVLIDALNESPEFEVVGWTGSMSEGVELVQNQAAEILFLDIKLQNGTAFQLLNHLKAAKTTIPPVVINTGIREFEHAQQVLNDFRDQVIFILKKPFWEHWQNNQHRIVELIYSRNQTERLLSRGVKVKKMINVQNGAQNHLIKLEDVLRVKTGEKGQGKTEIIFENHSLSCNLSLAQMMAKLPHTFVQVNRFEAVNIHWISIINQSDRQLCLRNGICCNVGDAFYKDLMNALEE